MPDLNLINDWPIEMYAFEAVLPTTTTWTGAANTARPRRMTATAPHSELDLHAGTTILA